MTEDELHERMEAIEARLAAHRRALERLTDQQRMDIGNALESLSEVMERHEAEREPK